MFSRPLAFLGLSASLMAGFSTAAHAQILPPSTPVIIWNDDKPAQQPAAATPAATTAAPCADCGSPAAPAPDFGGCWQTRSKLTGDWGGFRNDLACRGITLDASLTQFYQGVLSGGRDEDYFYGGRLDYFLNIDGEKAGLMKGSFISLHAEQIYGLSANSAAGTFLPVSVGQIFPNPTGNDIALTGIKYTQFLSENFAVFGGKINTLDEWKQPFAGGRGVDAFMNMSMSLPPVLARTVPYSSWGAGFVVLKDLEPVFTFAALDTADSTRNTGFTNFFDNGVTLMATATLPVKLNCLPGHHTIGGTYSTGSYTSLDRTSYFDPNDGGFAFMGETKRQGSWSLFYAFDQALGMVCCDPKRTWGIFGSIGIADEDPSPIRWAANIGIGGSSPITSRTGDTFGLAYFYTGLTDNLKEFAPRVLPLRDEQGIELFYNLGVTPWCHITPDFQVVLPGRDRFDTAVLFGLRMKIDF